MHNSTSSPTCRRVLALPRSHKDPLRTTMAARISAAMRISRKSLVGASNWQKLAGMNGCTPAMRTPAPLAVAHGSLWRATSSGATSAAGPEIVVFGGNGFVGSQVCKALVGMGLRVAAINRSGAPREKEEWMSGVDYIAADVFEPSVLLCCMPCCSPYIRMKSVRHIPKTGRMHTH